MIRRYMTRWVCLGLVFCGLGIASVASALTYTHELSQEALQDKLSAMMPIENTTLFFTVTVFDPRIELLVDTDRIGIFMQLKIKGPGGLQAAGRGKMSGSVSYNAQEKAFYLHDPVVEHIAVDGVEEQVVAQAKQLLQIALSSTVLLTPIYRFDPSSEEFRFAQSNLQSVEVKDGKLLLTLDLF